jgi:hypothetical protein
MATGRVLSLDVLNAEQPREQCEEVFDGGAMSEAASHALLND